MRTDTENLRAHLNSIGRIPLLTPAEEIMCGKTVALAWPLKEKTRLTAAEKRIVRSAAKARQRLVEGNLRLVVTIAKGYANRAKTLSLLDLIQEGTIGLIRAAELFDASRGYKFSTYCYWWVRQSMLRAIDTTDRTIRRPSTVSAIASKMPKVISSETMRLGRPPSRKELAAALKVSEQELETYIQRGISTVSLDMTCGRDDESSVIENIPDPNSLEKTEQEEALDIDLRSPRFNYCLGKLSESERAYVILRYGLNGNSVHTLKQIGDQYGICRERVRQVLSRAQNKLRNHLLKHDLGPSHTRRTSEQFATGGAPVAIGLKGGSAEAVRRQPEFLSAQAQQCDSLPSAQRSAA